MNKNVFLEELKNLFKDLDELNNSFQEEMLKKVDFYRLNRIEIIDKEVFLALDKWNNKIKRDYSNLCKSDDETSEEGFSKKFESIESQIQNKLSQVDTEIFGKDKLFYELSYFNMDKVGKRSYKCLDLDSKYSCSVEANHLTLIELELNKDDIDIVVSNILINDGCNDRILIYFILHQSENRNEGGKLATPTPKFNPIW